MIITLEIVAIILSLFATAITVVGFFASLKFYREGMNLQNTANAVLARIAEKTELIQTEVRQMSDKTIDALISRGEGVGDKVDEIRAELEQTKETIIGETRRLIGAAGDEQQRRFFLTIEEGFRRVEDAVESTQKYS